MQYGRTFLRRLITPLLPLLMLMVSCEEYEAPNPVWPPEEYTGANPAIMSIEPENTEGALRIFINGQNFSADPEKNEVYFDGVLAENYSVSPTEIVVYRPPVTGDSINVHVFVDSTLLLAQAIYHLDATHTPLTTRTDLAAMGVDDQGHSYAIGDQVLYRITPDGTEESFATSTRLDEGMEVRVGPGDMAYVVSQARTESVIFQALPAGDSLRAFFVLDEDIASIDFDDNSNLYIAGDGIPLYVAEITAAFDTIATMQEYPEYEDFEFFSVRVFDGYLYFAGEYSGDNGSFPEMGIWRTPIESNDGQLGAASVVYDWTTSDDSLARESDIMDFTIADDGAIYIAADSPEDTPTQLVYILENGELDILYKDILPYILEKIVWGNDTYMYGVSSDNGILKIQMGKQGAPYYGR